MIQDFADQQTRQLKKLAKFDLNAEEQLRRISVYQFMDHLLAIHDEGE